MVFYIITLKSDPTIRNALSYRGVPVLTRTKSHAEQVIRDEVVQGEQHKYRIKDVSLTEDGEQLVVNVDAPAGVIVNVLTEHTEREERE